MLQIFAWLRLILGGPDFKRALVHGVDEGGKCVPNGKLAACLDRESEQRNYW